MYKRIFGLIVVLMVFLFSGCSRSDLILRQDNKNTEENIVSQENKKITEETPIQDKQETNIDEVNKENLLALTAEYTGLIDNNSIEVTYDGQFIVLRAENISDIIKNKEIKEHDLIYVRYVIDEYERNIIKEICKLNDKK